MFHSKFFYYLFMYMVYVYHDHFDETLSCEKRDISIFLTCQNWIQCNVKQIKYGIIK